MTPLILIGALVLVVLGFLIAFEVIPLFPEKKRERPKTERKVTAPRD